MCEYACVNRELFYISVVITWTQRRVSFVTSSLLWRRLRWRSPASPPPFSHDCQGWSACWNDQWTKDNQAESYIPDYWQRCVAVKVVPTTCLAGYLLFIKWSRGKQRGDTAKGWMSMKTKLIADVSHLLMIKQADLKNHPRQRAHNLPALPLVRLVLYGYQEQFELHVAESAKHKNDIRIHTD